MKKPGMLSVLILALSLNAAAVSAQNMNSGSMKMMNSSAKSGMTQSPTPNNMMSMRHGGMMSSGMMGMMRSYMQNMMNTPMRRMMMSVYILPSLDTLGLSSSQKSKLGKIKSDYLKKQQDMTNKMGNLQSKLTQQLSSESFNMKSVHKLITQRAELQGNRQWVSIDAYNSMMSVLNNDQKKQFKGMRAQGLMSGMTNNTSMNNMITSCQSMCSTGQGMMNGSMMYHNGGNNQ